MKTHVKTRATCGLASSETYTETTITEEFAPPSRRPSQAIIIASLATAANSKSEHAHMTAAESSPSSFVDSPRSAYMIVCAEQSSLPTSIADAPTLLRRTTTTKTHNKRFDFGSHVVVDADHEDARKCERQCGI